MFARATIIAVKSAVAFSELRREHGTARAIEKSQTIALPTDWSKEMLEKLEREEKSQAQSADAFAEANRKKIFALQEKLDKLLEGYLDNLIDEETYKRKKENSGKARGCFGRIAP